MGCYNSLILIIRRVLQRSKFVYLIFFWQYHYAARMLPGGALNLNAALSQPVLLGFSKAHIMLLAVFKHISYSGFFRHAADSTRTEYVGASEKLFNIFMYDRLIYARKVKVYIRRLIPLKAHKHFKRYIKALTGKRLAADRAVPFRQIQAAAVFLNIHVKIAVFAVRADIMGRQRVNLGYIRHSSSQRRADRTARTNQIPIRQGFGHYLMRDKIQHCKAVLYNSRQLFIQPLFHNLRQGVAVYFVGLLHHHLAYLFLSALHLGSI